MYGKSYEAKKILHKKSKRPFPKEVAEQVGDTDDLFQALFVDNIKGIKLKAKEVSSSDGEDKKAVKNKPGSNSNIDRECNLNTEYCHDKSECYSSTKKRTPKFFKTKETSNGGPIFSDVKNWKRNMKTVDKKQPNLNDSWSRFLEEDEYDTLIRNVPLQISSAHINEIKGVSSVEESKSSNCPYNTPSVDAKTITTCEPNEPLSRETVEKKYPMKETLCSTPLKPKNQAEDVWSPLSPIPPMLASYHLVNGKYKKNCGKENIDNGLSDDTVLVSQFGNLSLKSRSNRSKFIDTNLGYLESAGGEKSGKSDVYKSACFKHMNLREGNTCEFRPISPEIFERSECVLADVQSDVISSLRSDTKQVSSYDAETSEDICNLSSDSSSSTEVLKSPQTKSPRTNLCSPDPFQSTLSFSEDFNHDVHSCESNYTKTPSDISVCSPNNSKMDCHVLLETDNSETEKDNQSASEVPFSNNFKTSNSEQRKEFCLPVSLNCRRRPKPKWSVVRESLVSIDEHKEMDCTLVQLNEKSLNSTQCRFTSRKSHVVVPLESFYSAAKRSTGFREAHMLLSSSFRELKLSVDSNESVLDTNDIQDPSSFKDLVLKRCGQSDILKFSEVFPDSSLMKCVKVGEGVYGEVFSRCLPDGQNTVLKIIPIEGSCKINGEIQKLFQEILSEIVITMELSNLRDAENSCTSNFPELIGCYCVQGKYPLQLLELWEDFYEKKTSENDCPDILPEDQIFIILELANVGTALEGFVFNSALQAFSAFKQITFALAVAERNLEFEHRDLHWGNVLIQPSNSKKFMCVLDGREYCFPNSGIQASIIDFTLSRMTFEGCCVFNNLSEDPALFEGAGDYQFDVYRIMKDNVNDNWQVFEPYNNVIWLSYVLDKLCTEVHYRNKTSKIHKKGMKSLQNLRSEILQYKSAIEVTKSFES